MKGKKKEIDWLEKGLLNLTKAYIGIMILPLILIFLLFPTYIYLSHQEMFFKVIFFLIIESILIIILIPLLVEIIRSLIFLLILLIQLVFQMKKFSLSQIKSDLKKLIEHYIKSYFPVIYCIFLILIYFSTSSLYLFTVEPIIKYFKIIYSENLLILITVVLVILIASKFLIPPFSKEKSSNKKEFLRYGILTTVFILSISFMFTGIQVDNLNNTDLFDWNQNLNCTYPTASKNVVMKDSYTSCTFSSYNKSSNYSVEYVNIFDLGNNISSTMINISENKSNLMFPNTEGVYNYDILENNKPKFIIRELKVVSFEKYLEVGEDIKKEKHTLFVSTLIFFSASIIFLIEIERWYYCNKKRERRKNKIRRRKGREKQK